MYLVWVALFLFSCAIELLVWNMQNKYHHTVTNSSSVNYQINDWNKFIGMYFNPLTADPVKALHFAILV